MTGRRTVTVVNRLVAGKRQPIDRSIRRPTRIMSQLRPIDPPRGPSRVDVVRLWEELEWWSCVYCDADFSETVIPEVDHINPLAKGGLHEWGNLAPACAECNRSKSDRDLGEWLSDSAGQEPARPWCPNRSTQGSS